MLIDYEARYLSEPGAVGLPHAPERVGTSTRSSTAASTGSDCCSSTTRCSRVLELVGPPHRMSPTELSEILVRSSGGVTQILDRLERARLVARAPDPDDRRKVVVELTAEGLRTADDANATYAREREQLLAGLSSDEIDRLDEAVSRLLEVLTAPPSGASVARGVSSTPQ